MSDGKSFSDRILEQDHLLRPNGPPDRVQHQKKTLCAFGVVRIDENLPDQAKQGPFAISGDRRAACRFSNGQPVAFKDQAPDVRGVAIKFFAGDQEVDLLATNEGGRSHARDTAEFVDVSDILATNIAKGALSALKEVAEDLVDGKLSLAEGIRIGRVLRHETGRPVESLTTEEYWGSVVELAGKPIKYSLQPHSSTVRGTDADRNDPDFLRQDLVARLRRGPIRFDLCLHFFLDDRKTPVNDASVKWDSPPVTIGELEIPMQQSPIPEDEEQINQMAFNPGNGFVPLGITKDRMEVYAASAHNRSALSSAEVLRIFRSH